MDGSRFDTWTKRLAQGQTRRRLLRGLAGGLTAAGLGTVARQTGEAFICRQHGVLCAKDAQCCSGQCIAFHCACPAGQVPDASGTCVTPCQGTGAPCRANPDCCSGTCLAAGSCAASCSEDCAPGVCNPYTGGCCLSADSCCGDDTTCAAQCCSGVVAHGLPACGGGAAPSCSRTTCGSLCASDTDCVDSTCVGGTCTCASGFSCLDSECRPG